MKFKRKYFFNIYFIIIIVFTSGNNQQTKQDEAYNLQDDPLNNGDINSAKKESSFFLSKALQRSQDSIGSFFEDNSKPLGIFLRVTIFLMFTSHFIWATYYFIDQTGKCEFRSNYLFFLSDFNLIFFFLLKTRLSTIPCVMGMGF